MEQTEHTQTLQSEVTDQVVLLVTVSGNAVTVVTITDSTGSGYTFASIKASEIGNVSGADIDFIISIEGWTYFQTL